MIPVKRLLWRAVKLKDQREQHRLTTLIPYVDQLRLVRYLLFANIEFVKTNHTVFRNTSTTSRGLVCPTHGIRSAHKKLISTTYCTRILFPSFATKSSIK